MNPQHDVSADSIDITYVSGSEPVRAVASATLVADRGEVVVVSGESGSGKTSLMQCIAGLTRPSAGTVTLDGVDLWSLGTDARDHQRLTSMAMIFQDGGLLAGLDALDNVALPLAGAGLPWQDARRAAADALARVGVSELSDRQPAAMSGGQRQRVALARALVGSSWLLLADEPTASLDEDTTDHVLAILRQEADRGRCVVIISHDRRSLQITDRSYRMSRGVLTASGTSAD